MSGSRAPTVALQTPLSLVKAVGPPGHSPATLTSFAFGARKRNVTLRSGWTSGDTSGAASRRERALVRAGSAFGGAASWARREMSERTDRSRVTVFIVGNRLIKRGGPRTFNWHRPRFSQSQSSLGRGPATTGDGGISQSKRSRRANRPAHKSRRATDGRRPDRSNHWAHVQTPWPCPRRSRQPRRSRNSRRRTASSGRNMPRTPCPGPSEKTLRPGLYSRAARLLWHWPRGFG